MTNYKFSIIIPVYKVEQYICQCIDSVISQSFDDYEVILVDDGSPDACPEICDDYAQKYHRVKVIHKPNGGLSDARNAGLDAARGEYVLFLESDDWWDDAEFLYKLNKTVDTTASDMVIFGMKKYFTADNRMGDIRIPKKCDKAVRRSLIEEYKIRFVKGQLSEDIEWCSKLLLTHPQIEVLEETSYVYRQQVSTSITANVSARNINCILDIIHRYATNDASNPLLNFLANQYVLLITNFMRLAKSEKKQLEHDVKAYWWLLDYDWYPYVKKVSIVKSFGFYITKNLLRLYYIIHR